MANAEQVAGWRAAWLRVLQAICALNGHPTRHTTITEWTFGSLVFRRTEAVRCERCWKWLNR